jgi:prolipoprotein diacylglyceryltransferase
MLFFLPEEGAERAGNARPGHVEASASAVFLIGYGTVRFVAGFFRDRTPATSAPATR